jgi:hypothetical protein
LLSLPPTLTKINLSRKFYMFSIHDVKLEVFLKTLQFYSFIIFINLYDMSYKIPKYLKKEINSHPSTLSNLNIKIIFQRSGKYPNGQSQCRSFFCSKTGSITLLSEQFITK